MPRIEPTVIDLFCGAGGFSLGFAQAGFNVIGGIDNNPIHTNTFLRNIQNSRVQCTDIARISAKEIISYFTVENKPIDIIIGGPPCQGFSLIGKRDLKDERNMLISHFFRIVGDIKPKYFALENVNGLIQGETKYFFDGVLKQFGEINKNYRFVEPYQVLDAQDFGIPQRRKRIFVLGYRKDLPRPNYPKESQQSVKVWDAISDLSSISRCKYLFENDVYTGKLGFPTTYSKSLRKTTNNPGENVFLSNCKLTAHTPAIIKRFERTQPGRSEPISRFFRLSKDGVSPTLRAGTGPEHGSYTAPRPIHPTQDRCITVREAARLHSFPDWFDFDPTIWHGFQQIGNSVPPILAKVIASEILTALMK
jgi:DNA (cytosine-5)-methyltransferase 1